MATFLWTKERTGWLWDRRDKCEREESAATVPSEHLPRNSSSPLFQDKGKKEPSTHTKVNTEMIPTVTRSCREIMA